MDSDTLSSVSSSALSDGQSDGINLYVPPEVRMHKNAVGIVRTSCNQMEVSALDFTA
jgi:hypothetical protein